MTCIYKHAKSDCLTCASFVEAIKRNELGTAICNQAENAASAVFSMATVTLTTVSSDVGRPIVTWPVLAKTSTRFGRQMSSSPHSRSNGIFEGQTSVIIRIELMRSLFVIIFTIILFTFKFEESSELLGFKGHKPKLEITANEVEPYDMAAL